MKSINSLTVSIWRVLAAVLAITMAVYAVEAASGNAEFPWWHLPSLWITWKMGRCGEFLRVIFALRSRPVRQDSVVKERRPAKDTLSESTQGRLRRSTALLEKRTA